MEHLERGATQFGILLQKAQLTQFQHYLDLLLVWNTRLNLTAIREPEEIEVRHFLDGLTCSLATGNLNGHSLIDVGTGAGFPGLPLKILFPELRLTLVESVRKKCDFLRRVVDELNLSDVDILTQRVEQVGQDPTHREQYDWAVARAVAELCVLAEYLLPLCRVGGHMLAQKGENAAAETAVAQPALQQLGGGTPHLLPIRLPNHPLDHYLIVIQKRQPTPARYPRRPGMPAKRPLRKTDDA